MGEDGGNNFILEAPLFQGERNLDTNFITSQRCRQVGTSDFS